MARLTKGLRNAFVVGLAWTLSGCVGLDKTSSAVALITAQSSPRPGSRPGATLGTAQVTLTEAAFNSTVYAYAKTANCTTCHNTLQGPHFVSDSVSTAFKEVLPYVNVKQIDQSTLAVRVTDQHCKIAAICGVDPKPMIAALQKWQTLSAMVAPIPSASPSTLPSVVPSPLPSATPSMMPLPIPSVSPSPTVSPRPSSTPSSSPSPSPSPTVSPKPSATPSASPSPSPSPTVSPKPSATPSASPTMSPRPSPSPSPTVSATPSPSPTPSPTPSPSPTQAIILTSAAYRTSVYAYVQTQGCVACHNNSQIPYFGSDTLNTAFQAAVPLVDLQTAANSKLAIRVSNNHCGVGTICGVNSAPMIAAIQQWEMLSLMTPAPSPTPSPSVSSSPAPSPSPSASGSPLPSPSPSPTPTVDACAGAPTAATAPRIVRLSRAEFNNSIADLLNDQTSPAQTLPPEDRNLGYSFDASVLTVNDDYANKLMDMAEKVAAARVAALVTSYPCAAAAPFTSCGQTFITQFGQKAFRRPLTATEITDLQTVFTTGVNGNDYSGGLQLVTQALLQAPSFVYRTELGDGTTSTQLTQYEIAAQLSALILGTTSDQTLLTAAAQNQLSTPAQIETQATRLLKDARAGARLNTFITQWLKADQLYNVNKDSTLYPGFSAIRDKMNTETLDFVQDTVFTQNGTMETLLSGQFTWVDSELAAYYGLPAVTADGAFHKVNLAASTGRAGLLTQGAFLASLSNSQSTSPTKRGKQIRTNLFCQVILPPPPDAPTSPPTLTPGSTTRQRMAAHVNSASCTSCHKLMDPVGFGFENFDTDGKWRFVENSQTVDASWSVTNTATSDSTGADAASLVRSLASSPDVAQCFVQQWNIRALGRAMTSADSCYLKGRGTQFNTDGHNVQKLILEFVKTKEFVTRSTQ